MMCWLQSLTFMKSKASVGKVPNVGCLKESVDDTLTFPGTRVCSSLAVAWACQDENICWSIAVSRNSGVQVMVPSTSGLSSRAMSRAECWRWRHPAERPATSKPAKSSCKNVLASKKSKTQKMEIWVHQYNCKRATRAERNKVLKIVNVSVPWNSRKLSQHSELHSNRCFRRTGYWNDKNVDRTNIVVFTLSQNLSSHKSDRTQAATDCMRGKWSFVGTGRRSEVGKCGVRRTGACKHHKKSL